MDVTCEKCRTEYEFEDSLVSESGTTVKCTSCGHLFRLFKPGTPASTRLSSWMLRQPDGSVYTFERLATLQRWIAEGKASRDDMVSRSGDGWKSLGDIAELAPFFEAAEAARGGAPEGDDWPDDDGPTIRVPAGGKPAAKGEIKATMTGYGPPAAPPPKEQAVPAAAVPSGGPRKEPAVQTGPAAQRGQTAPATHEPSLGDVPAAASENWQQGNLLQDDSPAWTDRPSGAGHDGGGEEEPVWTEGRISHTSIPKPDADGEGKPKKASSGAVAVGTAVVLAIALAAGGIWYFRPDIIRSWMDQLVTSEREAGGSEAYLRGREYFLLDTTGGFEQADREYHRAGDDDGLTRSGLAEVYTAWAQYYLDEVADARLRAEKAEATDAAALRARADLRNEEFQQKLEQARRFIDAALKNAPAAAESHRAAADYYRLAGEPERAKVHIGDALDRARNTPGALPETQYVAALVDLTLGGDAAETVGQLRSVVAANDKIIRCHYRLARLLAARDQRVDSLESLERVLALNPDHERARELRESLRGSEPLLVAVASATIMPEAEPTSDAGTDGDAGDGDVALAAAGDAAPAPDAASDAGAAAAEISPEESPDSLLRRATKLQRAGSRQACSLFKTAEQLRRGHPAALTGLGYCALDEGRSGAAVGYFRRALAGSGSHGPALIGMAEASRAMGATQQSLDYYRRYLRSHPGGREAVIARRNVERLESQLGLNEAPPPEAPTQPPSEPSTPPTESPTPTPPSETAPGTPDQPSVTRITEERPPETRSDSLATESEPPLRPGEVLE